MVEGSKTSALTNLTGVNVASADEIPIVDTDAGATKAITAGELLNYINLGLLFEVVTISATDASYEPTSTFELVNLDDSSSMAIIYADPIPDGSIVVYHATDAGTSHVVRLASGQTFDGTNNQATFNAADDRLVIVALSSTRVLIVYNNSVTFNSI